MAKRIPFYRYFNILCLFLPEFLFSKLGTKYTVWLQVPVKKSALQPYIQFFKYCWQYFPSSLVHSTVTHIEIVSSVTLLFFNSPVFSQLQSRMAKHAFSILFFAKKRTASGSKIDKIVTVHISFCCPVCLLYYLSCMVSQVIVLTHGKLLLHLYQAKCLLKVRNCCKIIILTQMVQLCPVYQISCLRIKFLSL